MKNTTTHIFKEEKVWGWGEKCQVSIIESPNIFIEGLEKNVPKLPTGPNKATACSHLPPA
jgi:hypothetical protein